MARKIVLTSGMSGIGQSTVCALIGQGLSLLNKKVVLIDLSMGNNNLHRILNLNVNFDICDVISSRCRLKQALVPVKEAFQLYCLPCAGFMKGNVSVFLLEELFKSVNENFDFMIIDCPSLIELPYFKVINQNSETIIISNTQKTCVLAANNVASCVCGCEIINLKLFVNNISSVDKNRSLDSEIASWLNIELFDSLLHQKTKFQTSMIENLSDDCIRFGKKLLGLPQFCRGKYV